jgi:hypothetical protein
MQASYRLWQTRCVPQCKRACEQVARCWADASLEDILINSTPTVTTRTALKIKRVMTSCERSLLRPRCSQPVTQYCNASVRIVGLLALSLPLSAVRMPTVKANMNAAAAMIMPLVIMEAP